MAMSDTRMQLEQSARLAAAAPGLEWLAARRGGALADFLAAGFPTTAEEDWRYTDISGRTRSLAAGAPDPAVRGLSALDGVVPEGPSAARAVFADGRLVASQSDLPAGGPLELTVFSQATPAQSAGLASRIDGDPTVNHRLGALNLALLTDGLHVAVAPGAALEDPIHVVFAPGSGFRQNRLVVDVGAGSRCVVIEHHVGGADGTSNSVTDVRLGAAAELRYVKLQLADATATHLASQHFTIGADARAQLVHLDVGSSLSRNDLVVRLAAPGAAVDAEGLFIADEGRHLDNHTRIEHAARATTSRESYRGIADGRGRGVFNGKVVVEAGADGSDARLTSQNLLLSAGAEIDTKPELEIYADDVKCSHGATVGQLDQNALFYLRSRGIPGDAARRMLIAAFARQVLLRLPSAALEARVMAALAPRLPDLGKVGSAP